jgi:DNA-binding transcriptional ArsR family regulator
MPQESVYTALADPVRRQILRTLRDREMTATEIAGPLPVSNSTVSHHLGVLKRAGLVACRREGTCLFYRQDTTVLQEVAAAILGWMRKEDEQ